MLAIRNEDTVEPIADYKGLMTEKEENGNFSISFDVFNTDRNNYSYNLIQEESIVEYDDYEFRIKVLEETRVKKSVQALSTFFDLKGTPIDDTRGGTLSIDEAFSFLLSYTDWTYEIVGSYEHELVPNFGKDNVIALFWKACEAFDVYVDIQRGNHLVIGKDIGTNDDFQFRYKHNVQTIKRSVDTSSFGTRIVGRGSDGLRVEYKSPIEDEYKENNPDFKPIYADEVKDDRINQESTMIEKLKRELQDKPEINLELETSVIGGDRKLYDKVWLIYEPMGIEYQTHIIKKTEYPHAPHKNKVELGNKKQTFTDLMTEQNIKIDENNNEIRSRIDQTNDRISLEVEEVDESIASLEVSVGEIRTSVEDLDSNVSSEISQLSDKIESRVTSDEAESIFEQKANSFTFSADQINFNGKVFGNSNAEFMGTVKAENVKGNQITGVQLRTGSSGKYIEMEEQNFVVKDGNLTKMSVGYNNRYGTNVNEPYIVMGHGNNSGKDTAILEKESRHFHIRYDSNNGESAVEFNYSGSVSIHSTNVLSLHSRYDIEADNTIRADDFKTNSKKEIKQDIKEYDDNATDVIKGTKIYTYTLKKDNEKSKLRSVDAPETFIGFMADEAPIIGDGEGISLYKATTLAWKSISELNDRLEKLEVE